MVVKGDELFCWLFYLGCGRLDILVIENYFFRGF